MSIFDQLLILVGEPPGSYVYHLVLLFALEAAAAIALSQWWARRDAARARLTVAAGGLFLLRLIPLLAALLAAASFLNALIALPPLDRAASTLTLLFIIWAFAFPEPQRLADVAVTGLVLIVLLALGITWPLWAQEVGAGASFYNASIQDLAWEIAQIALMLGGGLLLVVRRKSDWLLGLGLLSLLIAGHVLHVFRTVQLSNIPNAVRLAELVALPIFTAMVYRRAHASDEAMASTRPSAAARAAGDARPTSPGTAEPASRPKLGLDPKAAAALASLSTTASLEELAQLMLLAMAHTFRADLSLLITPPDPSGIASIAGGYDLIREKFLPGASLPLSEVPEVASALYQGQSALLFPDPHRAQIRYLAVSVGVDHVGPAFVAPFISEEGSLLAAVVLISAYSERGWSPDDQQLMEALAGPLAAAIHSAEKTARLNLEIEQQKTQLENARQEQQSAYATAGQVTEELDAARAETERLTLELDRVQAEMDQQREEADTLTRELQARHEAELLQSELADEITTLRAHLQQTQHETEERGRLEAELNAAQERMEALAELEAKLDSLAREAEARQQRAQELAAELERARAEAQSAQTQAETHQQRVLELSTELEQARAEAQALSQKSTALLEAQTATATLAAETPAPSPEIERLQAELEQARQKAQDNERLEEERQEAVENLKLQASLAADLQMEITTYKQLETQLQRELELTRAELKKFTDQTEASALVAQTAGPALAEAQAALAAAQTELDAKSQKLTDALDQLGRKERQLAKAQEALSAMSGQSKSLEQLQAQLLEKERRLAAAQSELAALAERAHALPLAQQQLAEKEKQLGDAQLLIAEMYEQASALPALREQLAEKERLLAAAQSAIAAPTGRTGQLERLQADLAEAQAALAAQTEALAQAKAQLAEKERQLSAAISDLAALAGPTQLPDELAKARSALAQAHEQLAEKERELAAERAHTPTAAAGPPGMPRTTAPFSAPSYEAILSLVQELRQPMSSIVGYSDLLLGESVGILGALQHKFLERIMASCERMEALLDDLIRVTAFDSGKLKVARDSLDVMAVVEEAILGCGAQFREKSINLRLDLADNLPAVFADRDALRQIVSHLLNNAANASAIDGEVTLSVRVQPAGSAPQGGPGDGLFIAVRDSGGGVAPDDQPRVFSRTYRADAPLIAGLGDTAGMGLFIAKALTEAQGGRIWLTSELGQGSTISVMLPIAGQPLPVGGNGSNPPDN
ncbi:MAG: putative two-component sensor histidine kinase [Anaerolineales bacterium]|nr:putative two-component sensor histidine kinase [Anaerolineales bacterium]